MLFRSQAVTAEVVRELRRSPEVAAVFSTIGAGATKRVNEAELFVQLVHKSQREVSQQRFMADLRGRIRGQDGQTAVGAKGRVLVTNTL